MCCGFLLRLDPCLTPQPLQIPKASSRPQPLPDPQPPSQPTPLKTLTLLDPELLLDLWATSPSQTPLSLLLDPQPPSGPLPSPEPLTPSRPLNPQLPPKPKTLLNPWSTPQLLLLDPSWPPPRPQNDCMNCSSIFLRGSRRGPLTHMSCLSVYLRESGGIWVVYLPVCWGSRRGWGFSGCGISTYKQVKS